MTALRAFVVRRVPRGEAEDVLQDILLRLHEGAAALREGQRAKAWTYGIARRTIADFYRRRPPDSASLDELEMMADSGHTLPENLTAFSGNHDVHEEVLSWLRPFADSLPEPYREALLMADFQGLPQQAVADRQGVSLSGAKSRIQRARKMVGDALQACCTVEFGSDGRAASFRPADCRDC